MSSRTLSRLIWSALALLALATLLTARLLTPAASGHGTHVALGLPPCGFLLWSGLPCPACGLTTAFAQLAHGQLMLSLAANPLGLPLFACAVWGVPLALFYALRGVPVLAVIDRLQADRVALCLAGALLLSWATRVFALSF
jgi:Protein of unknown function (DUF2752)